MKRPDYGATDSCWSKRNPAKDSRIRPRDLRVVPGGDGNALIFRDTRAKPKLPGA